MAGYRAKSRKSNYSAGQKRAYHSGQAYKIAENEKAISFKNPKNKESFIAGYKSITSDRLAKMSDNRKARERKAGGK